MLYRIQFSDKRKNDMVMNAKNLQDAKISARVLYGHGFAVSELKEVDPNITPEESIHFRDEEDLAIQEQKDSNDKLKYL